MVVSERGVKAAIPTAKNSFFEQTLDNYLVT